MVWWHRLLWRLMLGDHESKVCLGFRMNSRPAWTT